MVNLEKSVKQVQAMSTLWASIKDQYYTIQAPTPRWAGAS